MVSLIVLPVAQALVGPLSQVIGVETTLVLAGLLAAAALASALSVPDFRHLRRLDDEPAAEPAPAAVPLPAELHS